MDTPNTPTLLTVIRTVFQRVSKPATVFVWGTCCIICVLAGPFGTYEAMSVGARAAYWTVLISLGVVMGFASFGACIWWLGKEKNPIFPILAATVMTLVYGPVIIALRASFAARIEALEVFPLSMAINTFLITAAVFAFRQFLPLENADWFSSEPDLEDAPETAIQSGRGEPRLLRRLPDTVKAPVLCLSANDHHVEVVTKAGRHVLRMRLVDAIDEMEPVMGMCVHRSHWVAREAIVQVERLNAHKTQVHLSNGDILPVSRKYKLNLDDAGLTETSIAAS